MRSVEHEQSYKVFAEPGADALKAYVRLGEEIEPLKKHGKFEECLERIVAESRKSSSESAPLWNRAYNENYRQILNCLPA